MLSLPPILTRFVEQTPVPVMARALIERVVGAQALGAWFEEQRAGQYTRELLFSTLFGLMTQVCCARARRCMLRIARASARSGCR